MGIVAPPDAAFRCHRCNQCCRGAWIIGITGDEAASLRALYPAIEPVDGEAGERDGVRFLRMARRASGECVYLDPDGCRIHKEHGEAAKPAICRRFPFSLTTFGATTFLHLSRVCPSVYAERGDRGTALLEAAASADVGITAIGSRRESAPESVLLAGTRRISYADYLVLERRIDRLIRDERWPLDDAMAAVVVLIRRWADHPDVEARRAEAGDESMDLVMEAIARRAPLMGLHRYILATLVTVIESRRHGRFWSREFITDFARYARILMARGRDRLAGSVRDAGPVDVNLAALGHVTWPRRQAPSLVPVRSLIASHVHRKLLLTSGPDIEFSWHLMLIAYAVLKFYARANAVAAGRDELIPTDVEEGVRIAEYHLLLHPQHLPPLQTRFLGGWFRRFLFHPAFPSSMTCL